MTTTSQIKKAASLMDEKNILDWSEIHFVILSQRISLLIEICENLNLHSFLESCLNKT